MNEFKNSIEAGLARGKKMFENADAPMRDKCEWCGDPDGQKRNRKDGSIVYQCWKCRDKVPLDDTGPVKKNAGDDGFLSECGMVENPEEVALEPVPPAPAAVAGETQDMPQIENASSMQAVWDSADKSRRELLLGEGGLAHLQAELIGKSWSALPSDVQRTLQTDSDERRKMGLENASHADGAKAAWAALGREDRMRLLAKNRIPHVAGEDLADMDWEQLPKEAQQIIIDDYGRGYPENQNSGLDRGSRRYGNGR